MATNPGAGYVDQRISLLVAGKTDEMVDAGYNEDAVLVSFDGTVEGKQALKEHFAKHIPALGGVKLKSIDRIAETDTAVFIQVTVITGSYGEVTSYEAFTLRNGKADVHFTVLK
jgi:hypothetical protein